MRILVIEDDEKTAAFIAKGLTESGHVCDVLDNGRDGLFQASQDGGSYDVMVIDRMLPGLDGLGIIKTIRAAGVRTPVLFLTALSGIDDRVDGFQAGGDDYLVKPFAFAELVARIQALARRPPMNDLQTALKVADLEMDLLKRKVSRAGKEIDLQPREFRLLEFLMQNAGRLVTRTMLLEHVWEYHFDPRTNIVETHVSRLRSKVDRDFDKELIETVRGSGYLIRDPA